MKRVFGIGLCLAAALALTGCGPTAPDLTGMTRPAAQKAIAAAELVFGGVSYDAGSTAPTGTVVAQKPEAGERIDEGASIALTLAGPPPVPAPSLSGLDQRGAAAALSAAGLTLGAVVETYSATVPAGTLITQDPVPGADTPKGSKVDLIVSKGPAPVAVPKVVGKTQDAATKILTDAGFKVTVSGKSSAAVAGTVLAQSPSGGTAKVGASVSLTVSTGSLSAQTAGLVGKWKGADGTRYEFRHGGRVATPSGGVVRYRLSGSILTIFHSGRAAQGTLKWDSADQFRLSMKNSGGTAGPNVVYKRMP